MFGTKNEEILTYFLLIVVCYTIAKMFSRSCNGFKVGAQPYEPDPWVPGDGRNHVSPYKPYEPDPDNYPNLTIDDQGYPVGQCGFMYENGQLIKDSYKECDTDHTCVCLDKNNKIVQADENDFHVCNVPHPYKEGYLALCQECVAPDCERRDCTVKNWNSLWFVLYKTHLAYFDGPAAGGSRGGLTPPTRERKGYILLKEVLPGRVHPVDETMFGKYNVFQVETRDQTFYLQAETVDQLDDWLDSILPLVAVGAKGSEQVAALEAGEMDGPQGDGRGIGPPDTHRDSSGRCMSNAKLKDIRKKGCAICP